MREQPHKPFFVGSIRLEVKAVAAGPDVPEDAIEIITNTDGAWNLEGFANVLAVLVNEIVANIKDPAIQGWSRARILELLCAYTLRNQKPFKVLAESGTAELHLVPPKGEQQ